MKKQWLATAAAVLMINVTGSAMAGEAGISVVFTNHEIAVIRAYYRDNFATHFSKGNADGNGKPRKSLPPGIARNLERGKALPPGIAKQVLPTGLLDLLPKPRKGFERVEVDGKVLLVEIATQVIHDVLEDVILH